MTPTHNNHMVDEQKLMYEAALTVASAGGTIKKIAATLGCSPRYLSKILATNAPFRQSYEQARATGYALTADEIKTLVTDNPLTDVQMLRLHSDNAKWYLSKMDPARFGDKLDVTVSKGVDLRTAIAEGRSRTRIVNAEAIEAVNDPFAD
jgi:AraC-like DNA-binding protein